jgi:ribonucleotide reductase beta subunit family protein with ferritin-like domain
MTHALAAIQKKNRQTFNSAIAAWKVRQMDKAYADHPEWTTEQLHVHGQMLNRIMDDMALHMDWTRPVRQQLEEKTPSLIEEYKTK